MSNTQEIRQMISTATIGDGDQVLNILEKICDALDEIDRKLEVVENSKAERPYDPKERF